MPALVAVVMGSRSDWDTMRAAVDVLDELDVPSIVRMLAAHTVVPVLGVPVMSQALRGLDSLLSIVQMPGGVPVGTMAIGAAGAKNAGLLAAAIAAVSRPELRDRLR